jgi:hypothetical protein
MMAAVRGQQKELMEIAKREEVVVFAIFVQITHNFGDQIMRDPFLTIDDFETNCLPLSFPIANATVGCC